MEFTEWSLGLDCYFEGEYVGFIDTKAKHKVAQCSWEFSPNGEIITVVDDDIWYFPEILMGAKIPLGFHLEFIDFNTNDFRLKNLVVRRNS